MACRHGIRPCPLVPAGPTACISSARQRCRGLQVRLCSSVALLQQPHPPITMLLQDANFSGGLEHALLCVVREMEEKGISAEDLHTEAREEVGGGRAITSCS